ncbi:MAG: phosphoglycerate dehydrogenase [Granulosicoccus sp.]|nr:phosphoglycerate dehydrogenase [Granulosicoccus sp.]
MFRILVSDKLGQPGIDRLEQDQTCHYEVKTDLTTAQLIEAIPAYDGLIIRSGTKVTADVLSAARNLKVIGRAGIGVDNVDVKAASAAGVIVMNTPQANSVATAEHTIASLLAVCRHTAPAHASLLSGQWDRSRYSGIQLYRKKLGLIGFGRIARLVAQRARGFDMQVIAYDPYVSAEVGQQAGVELVDLDELLAMADMISLHTIMSPETENMINAESLAKTKKGVIIVNPSRGKLVDEEALAEAIRAGQVRAAAIDVYRNEPPDSSHPLIGIPEVLHTPHLGASTLEAQRDVAEQIVAQVLDALNGIDFRNSVNMPFSVGPNFSEVEPYMALASKIGALQFHMADAPIRKVELELVGEAVEELAKPVATGLLKGLLENITSDSVNYINAPTIANELGIEVSQSTGLSGSDYTNLITCSVEWDGGERVISGTLFAGQHPRIVQVSSYRIDVDPQGTMLIMMNKDVPGVIGNVGTLLGKHGVNIAEWRLGRSEKGDQALAMINLDSDLSDRALEEIQNLPAIVKVMLVQL